MTMRRATLWMLGVVCLAGCPDGARNSPADATVDAVVDAPRADVTDAAVADADVSEVDVTDADVTETGVTETGVTDADVTETGVVDADVTETGVVDADVTETGVVDADVPRDTSADVPPDVQMTFEFTSVSLVSPSTSGIQMRANMTWHGMMRGSAGGITFEGAIR